MATSKSQTKKADQADDTSQGEDRFATCVAQILDAEGGYVNDPRDPGGETNFGISKRAHPGVDIANLTRDGAAAIYRRDYWDAVSCGELPAPVDHVVFDAAVNQGTTAAVKTLQSALGVTPDGIVGPNTLGAVAEHDPHPLAERVLGYRAVRYARTDNPAFLRGWFNRLFELHRHILEGKA
ncbi:hypothetical protein CKO33_02250 [Ectothiorhodospira mobilis]|nr:glycosyl hydrolase 108 family protein [Ectothiorhodospira mobilis]MBK1690992.1 hypothetical protein [Ectothiorhodospira mobilis]